MQALSIQQPWADLIINNKKSIELRSWPLINYPKRIYIHSSKKPDTNEKRHRYDKSHLGKVIGKATIVNVKEYKSLKEFLKDKNKHLQFSAEPYTKKGYKFGFVLDKIEKESKPFGHNGNSRFTNVKKRSS